MTNLQITTVTIFKFKSLNAAWMFAQMGIYPRKLKKTKGLQFFKLMGSGGKNGFSRLINFKVYALLCVWDSEELSNQFFTGSILYRNLEKRSEEAWTIFMQNRKSHGQWSGQTPFRDFQDYPGGVIGVITRAKIKLGFLRKFWSNVPAVSENLNEQEGLIFSIGIGEYPWFMQATFSLWKDVESMQDYAYNSPLHNDVIKKTRALGWYSEELFANFIPFDSRGSWEGNNPLTQYLNQSSLPKSKE